MSYLAELEKIDIGNLTSKMIQIPSYSFLKNQEMKISGFIYEYFIEEGIECNLYEIEQGRYNVLAKIPGKGCGKSLMLVGHTDTVPPYDMNSPFEGTIREGNIYGRGTCDMKGSLASMMAALTAMKRANVQLDGDLYFAGVADEEEEGKGIRYLIEHGPIADGSIIGEPTGLRIARGHKGLEWIVVKFHGHKVHGGAQSRGVNAIEIASHFVNEIYQNYVPILSTRIDPSLGSPTINIGTIVGGDQPSTVPDYCEIKMDRRMVSSEDIKQVYKELNEIARIILNKHPNCRIEIEDMYNGRTLPHLPFVLDAEDHLIRCVSDALEETGNNVELTVFPAWTDAGFLASQTSSHCIVMGPGDLAVAHSTDENVNINQLYKAARIYCITAMRYCKG